MGILTRFFWRGMIVVLPVTLSVYLLIVVLTKAEGLFGRLIKNLFGPDLYIPGSGIVVTILLMIIVGGLVSNFITGSVINFFIKQFERVPLIKVIYNPLRDLMSLFAGSGQEEMKKVVMVDLGNNGMKSIGLVTREEFDDLPAGTLSPDMVAVYIPMSYMLGGFTTLIPRDRVQEVDIPVERAIKLAITGWIKAEKNGIS